MGLCACGNPAEAESAILAAKLETVKEQLAEAEYVHHYEAVIAALQELKDVDGAQAVLEEATQKLDEESLSMVKYYIETAKNGVDAKEYAQKISDKVVAEKICVWIDFQWYVQDVHKQIVDLYKNTLKNPNSYTDLGSTYTFTAKPSNKQGEILLNAFTLTLRYTATNSFGGAVQDTCEFPATDLTWVCNNDILTAEQICDTISYYQFGDLYNALSK